MIALTLQAGELCKQDALIVRGKVGFANSFLHGRQAFYSWNSCQNMLTAGLQNFHQSLRLDFKWMKRLVLGISCVVSAKAVQQWFVFFRCGIEPKLKEGGIGAANGLQLCFGDNDSARFSLIKGACFAFRVFFCLFFGFCFVFLWFCFLVLNTALWLPCRTV